MGKCFAITDDTNILLYGCIIFFISLYNLFSVYALLLLGWTMVFKAVSGVKENVYSTYTSGQTYHEKVLAALDVTNSYFNDYKNRIVLKWKDFGAAEV